MAELSRAPLSTLVSKAVGRTIGRLTSRWRALPDYLVIGTKRGGTTSLQQYLTAHPDVLEPKAAKASHYFDANYAKGWSWYRAHFPLQRWMDRQRAVGPAGRGRRGQPLLLLPSVGAGPHRRAFARGADDHRAARPGRAGMVAVLLRSGAGQRGPLLCRGPRCRGRAGWQAPRSASGPAVVPTTAIGGCTRTGAGGTTRSRSPRCTSGSRPRQLHVVVSEELFARPLAVMNGVFGFLGVEAGRGRHVRGGQRQPQERARRSDPRAAGRSLRAPQPASLRDDRPGASMDRSSRDARADRARPECRRAPAGRCAVGGAPNVRFAAAPARAAPCPRDGRSG